jgi:hypothetical protein
VTTVHATLLNDIQVEKKNPFQHYVGEEKKIYTKLTTCLIQTKCTVLNLLRCIGKDYVMNVLSSNV